MTSQYEVKSEKSGTLDITTKSFDDINLARDSYTVVNREYESNISKVMGHITKAKAQIPPYWDDNKNKVATMPMYQHNVSSGRFTHSMTQVSLPYNSLFPNKAYASSLIECSISEFPAIAEDGSDKFEKQIAIQEAFDKIIKNSDWARSEHLKVVSDFIHYGVGVYYFENPKSSYKYTRLDYRKIKFPIGTSTDVDSWEYLFIEYDIPLNKLINLYNDKSTNNEKGSGWQKDGLRELLSVIGNGHGTSVANTTSDNTINKIDYVRGGIAGANTHTSASVSIPVITCFWKNSDGKISAGTFVSNSGTIISNSYLYNKANVADKFSDLFTVLVADDTESEIRLSKGWGHRTYSLCHAYDRAFCKFLDHIDYSSSIFINMDPTDTTKKIINFGSVNIGKFDGIQGIPSVLRGLVEALMFLDNRIDTNTFTQGLNKTELLGGDTPNGELANIMLTVEGRVHKHLLTRFLEQYTSHWRKVLAKILKIVNNKAFLAINEELKIFFLDYLISRGLKAEDLKLDDTSDANYGLPTNWQVVSRKPDGSGITGSVPHVIKALGPYLSSLPEEGYKYILGRLVSEAFGDPEMVEKILPGSDIYKASAEADSQSAQVQIAVLTSSRSEFDRDFNLVEDIDPQLTDAHKFVTFPATKMQDNILYLTAIMAKLEDIQKRFGAKEIGRTTLHIWMYNLVSTAKNHVDILQKDVIRGNRPEAKALYEQFGQAFNLLRQVESQANADKAKKIDMLQKKLQEQSQDNPKYMEASAKLETARARQAEVQLKYDTNNFSKALETQQNRRAEENHVVDQRLKIKALLTPDAPTNQGGPGRNKDNYQG